MDKEKLIERQSELLRIIEAIDEVLHSRSWQVVRQVFDTRAESLDRQMLSEAKAKEIKDSKLYYLQGAYDENRRYDLATYAESCRRELQGIKQNLQ